MIGRDIGLRFVFPWTAVALAMMSLPCPPAVAESGTALTRYHKVVAVVVGIETYRYRRWKRLPNAEVDAKKFAALMRSRGATVHTLYGRKATREAIVNLLDRAANQATLIWPQNRNLLVFYFAGHGVTRSQEGYLVPYDGKSTTSGSWLTMGTLKQKSREMLHVRHQLWILGSCFSGTLFRSAAGRVSGEDLATRLPASVWLSRSLDKVTRVAITAGTEDQKIPDGPRGQGSAFGNAVVNALSPIGGSTHDAADYNRDGCVTAAEWFTFVANRGKSAMNTPFSGRLEGDAQGMAVLCRSWPTAPVTSPGLDLLDTFRSGSTPRARCTSGDLTACVAVGRSLATTNAAKALALFNKACDGKVTAGCVELGLALRNGPTPDHRRANALFSSACSAGSARACALLGVAHDRGLGLTADAQKANSLFESACQNGDMLGCNELAANLNDGQGATRDVARASTLAKRACDRKELSACVLYGEMLLDAAGTAGDVNRANSLFRRACDGKVAAGCYNLGLSLWTGKGLARDPVEAARLWTGACDRSHRGACAALGQAYNRGLGVKIDQKRAVALFLKACPGGKGGLALACTHIGIHHQRGFVLKYDQKKANAIFAATCAAGDTLGCAHRGRNLRDGVGQTRDVAAGNTLLKKTCDGGDLTACAFLGESHQYAIGMDHDRSRAEALYKKGCDRSNVAACARQGWLQLYQYNPSRKRNDRRMSSWAEGLSNVKGACDRGGPRGCTNYGLASVTLGKAEQASRAMVEGCRRGDWQACHERLRLGCWHRSVRASRDVDLPLKRLTAACAADVPRACVYLAQAHHYGCEVRKDYHRAYQLFLSACARGDGMGCFEAGQHRLQVSRVGIDANKAAGHFKRACDMGHGAGCGALGDLYLAGKVRGGRDIRLAHDNFRKACRLGALDYCGKGSVTE